MTVEADSILADESDADDGYDAFLTSFQDEDPKKAALSTKAAEAPETPANETAEAPEVPDKESETSEDTEADPDDDEVEIKVGEETKKATLRDLKRLYGQEAALTQKSQKVAEAQRAADTELTRASTALKTMLDKATERHKPYAALDMLVLSQRMDTETFAQLRADAAAAEADVKFLTQELDGTIRAGSEKAATANREAAGAAIKVLTDPASAHYIEGFGKPLYDDMMTYAEGVGLHQARTFVQPEAILTLHKAMLWDKAQAASKAAAAKVKAVVETPKRVIKPGAARTNTATGRNAAIQRMREAGGDDDSTTDAFLADLTR